MKIPTCNEITTRCICCGKEIKPHVDHKDDCVNVAVWTEAVVSTAFGGFKSAENGKAFVICVCDKCLKLAESDDRAYCFYNKYDMEDMPIEKSVPHQYIEIDLNFFGDEENGFNKAK